MTNPTGHEVIDTLRDIQEGVDALKVLPEKVAYINRCLGQLTVHRIFGSKLLIATSMAMGKGPDIAEDERLLFSDGLMFTARADSISYLYDPDIPVDALALEFDNPEIMEAILLASPEEAEELSKIRLQVPVMAIESVMDLDAA